jgi:hypothetical protein
MKPLKEQFDTVLDERTFGVPVADKFFLKQGFRKNPYDSLYGDPSKSKLSVKAAQQFAKRQGWKFTGKSKQGQQIYYKYEWPAGPYMDGHFYFTVDKDGPLEFVWNAGASIIRDDT